MVNGHASDGCCSENLLELLNKAVDMELMFAKLTWTTYLDMLRSYKSLVVLNESLSNLTQNTRGALRSILDNISSTCKHGPPAISRQSLDLIQKVSGFHNLKIFWT